MRRRARCSTASGSVRSSTTTPQVGCFFSGEYSPSKTWVVPAGKLAWNREYQWKIVDAGQRRAVTSGPPITLFTDVPQPAITSHIANNDGKSQDKPYDPAVGNYTTSALDIVVPVAGPELNVARTYNSLDPRRDGLFGAGWSSRYDMRLVIENDDNALVTYPDGRQVRFGKNADGTFAAPRGTKAVLTATSATGPWTLQIAPGHEVRVRGRYRQAEQDLQHAGQAVGVDLSRERDAGVGGEPGWCRAEADVHLDG